MIDSFCGSSQQNCETCGGSWCPYDGPGGSLTTTAQTTLVTSSTEISTTTSSTEVSTSTTNVITSTTTTSETSCGYMPTKCENKIRSAYDSDRFTKTYGQFQEITGVSQNDATFEDMQLYWFCKGKSSRKCTGMELPCGCSSPPCVCPGDETTTLTSTTLETSQVTSHSTTQTTTTTEAPSTTEATTTTSTQSTTMMTSCALSVCGCSQNGQSWCNSSNSWLATDWCHELSSNCENCNGVWCDGSIA